MTGIDAGVMIQGAIALLTILGSLVVANWSRSKTEAEAKKARAEAAQVTLQSMLDLEARTNERMLEEVARLERRIQELEAENDRLEQELANLRAENEEYRRGVEILVRQIQASGNCPEWPGPARVEKRKGRDDNA